MAPYPLGSNTTNFSFSFHSSCLKGDLVLSGSFCQGRGQSLYGQWFWIRPGSVLNVHLTGSTWLWVCRSWASIKYREAMSFWIVWALDITTCKEADPKKQPDGLTTEFSPLKTWLITMLHDVCGLRSPFHQPSWWILMSFESLPGSNVGSPLPAWEVGVLGAFLLPNWD